MSTTANTFATDINSQAQNKEIPSEFIKYWYAVYTVVRHEKKVNTALINKNIETYLPIKDFLSQWKDRKKRVQVPLFPGYVFVNISPNDSRGLMHIYNTYGVIRILGNNGQYTPIPVEQVNSIKSLLECGLDYDLYPYLEEGKEVIVTSGPMEGVTGKVVKRKGKDRLIVSVDLIKRSVGIELDALLVDLV